ncbi:MAG: hypothetical protein FJX77_01930, partial [Armatimonadetes bacterium]|nr:hypothetical protein [Armatimonadota bacterium]
MKIIAPEYNLKSPRSETLLAIASPERPVTHPPPPADAAAGRLSLWKLWRADWAAADPVRRGQLVLRAAGLCVLLGIPIGLLTTPQGGLEREWPGPRLVWTLIIALLPLALVWMGFYHWREVCPLAFLSRLSEWIEWPDARTVREAERRRRRVSPWLARNYPYVTWGFLAFALLLRLLILNSHQVALGLAFLGIIGAAIVVGFRYTGKSWCNFFCPVGVIERIYTDADRPQYARNSQCVRCTGCKTVPSGGLCPDINQENDYWQELGLRSRAFLFYATPGLILGFYLWFFFHRPTYWHDLASATTAGAFTYPRVIPPLAPGSDHDWGFYLSGDWTRDPTPWKHWLEPGFGFAWAPPIPTLLAAPLTLACFSALSWSLFSALELAWTRCRETAGDLPDAIAERVRHPLFVAAGFLTFSIFYLFAGAPTFRTLPPGGYELLRFVIVVTACGVLYTRLPRTRRKQLQNDQARKWIRRWPWKEAAPQDLDEAYTVYTLRTQDSGNRLRAYRDAVMATLSENLVSSQELGLLDRLAQDLGLSEEEQDRVMRELSREAPEFFDPGYKGSLGERLRVIGYRTELEQLLNQNKGIFPAPAVLQDLQQRYRIRPDEHEEVVRDFTDPEGARGRHLLNELKRIKTLQTDLVVLAANPGAANEFLARRVGTYLAENTDHVLRLASLYGPPGESDILPPGREAYEPAELEAIREWSHRHLPTEMAQALQDAICVTPQAALADTSATALAGMLLRLSSDRSVHVRAAAVYSLRAVLTSLSGEGGPAQKAGREAVLARVRRGLQDRIPLIREAAALVLVPDLPAETWAKLFADESPLVRRVAIHRLPIPTPPDLQGLATAALKDPDPEVWRAAQARLRWEAGLEAARPPGVPLSSLERVFALSRCNMLEFLPVAGLEQLVGACREGAFRRGHILCREGELGGPVYFLIEGTADVTLHEG